MVAADAVAVRQLKAIARANTLIERCMCLLPCRSGTPDRCVLPAATRPDLEGLRSKDAVPVASSCERWGICEGGTRSVPESSAIYKLLTIQYLRQQSG